MSRRAALATASLSLVSLWAGTATAAAPGDDLAAFTAKYNYCDAKILASFWKVSEVDAKARGGAKLAAHAADAVEGALTGGRQAGAACTFADTGFTYDDAVALSKLWKVSVEEAKAALASKQTAGLRDLANQVVAEARTAGKSGGDKPVKPVKPVKPAVKPVKPVKPAVKPAKP